MVDIQLEFLPALPEAAAIPMPVMAKAAAIPIPMMGEATANGGNIPRPLFAALCSGIDCRPDVSDASPVSSCPEEVKVDAEDWARDDCISEWELSDGFSVVCRSSLKLEIPLYGSGVCGVLTCGSSAFGNSFVSWGGLGSSSSSVMSLSRDKFGCCPFGVLPSFWVKLGNRPSGKLSPFWGKFGRCPSGVLSFLLSAPALSSFPPEPPGFGKAKGISYVSGHARTSSRPS